MSCANKIRAIYFCPNCVSFFARKHSFFFWGGGSGGGDWGWGVRGAGGGTFAQTASFFCPITLIFFSGGGGPKSSPKKFTQ